MVITIEKKHLTKSNTLSQQDKQTTTENTEQTRNRKELPHKGCRQNPTANVVLMVKEWMISPEGQE